MAFQASLISAQSLPECVIDAFPDLNITQLANYQQDEKSGSFVCSLCTDLFTEIQQILLDGEIEDAVSFKIQNYEFPIFFNIPIFLKIAIFFHNSHFSSKFPFFFQNSHFFNSHFFFKIPFYQKIPIFLKSLGFRSLMPLKTYAFPSSGLSNHAGK